MSDKPKITILNVDDDDAGRYVIRWTLHQAGFEVIEAASGTEALRLAKENPDLVILDVNLPDINGFEVCRRMKTDRTTSLIPILLLSGTYLDSQYKVEGLEGGADGYLTQPLEPPVLIATVKMLLRARQAEAEVRIRAQQWQATFDAIMDAIALLDMEGRVLQFNHAFADILKKPANEIVGHTCHKLMHSTAGFIEGCPFVRIGQTGCRETLELQVGDRWFRVTADPVLEDTGNIIGAIHIMSDITEHRKLENQLRHSQKMEAVGTLTGGVAHEFNNILTAIIGYASLLEMRLKDDDPLRIHVEQILASSERGANLTQSLLTFSRKQIIRPRPVNSDEIVKRVEKFLLRVIGEDIELRTIPTGTDAPVMADPTQIEQVLINLATNARDAMPEGGLLTIATRLVELDEDYFKIHNYDGNPGKYVLISVTDTGLGMDEKTRERIFEPFFTTKAIGRGTGLGLSIVYGIVKQHNGYINVYSEPGKGTTFRIFLPMIKGEVEGAQSTAFPPPTGGTETILMAEDNAEVRKLMKEVLERFGYKVIEAVDGEDAIKVFNENKNNVQLLLLDLIMPKMNGKEAYDEIRKIRPDIKVIFGSGYTSDIIDKKGILEEGLNFITKPISPRELLRKVREVLDQ